MKMDVVETFDQSDLSSEAKLGFRLIFAPGLFKFMLPSHHPTTVYTSPIRDMIGEQ